MEIPTGRRRSLSDPFRIPNWKVRPHRWFAEELLICLSDVSLFISETFSEEVAPLSRFACSQPCFEKLVSEHF